MSAYDNMLDHDDLWGIDVVNNSWGNAYQQYDPRNPVAVATKAVADQGVTVVFAAGNSGSSNGEASLNPFSQSPWVISVAAGTLKHERGEFSSNGFQFDNSLPVGIGAGGQVTRLAAGAVGEEFHAVPTVLLEQHDPGRWPSIAIRCRQRGGVVEGRIARRGIGEPSLEHRPGFSHGRRTDIVDGRRRPRPTVARPRDNGTPSCRHSRG